jgi:hypothetical protein
MVVQPVDRWGVSGRLDVRTCKLQETLAAARGRMMPVRLPQPVSPSSNRPCRTMLRDASTLLHDARAPAHEDYRAGIVQHVQPVRGSITRKTQDGTRTALVNGPRQAMPGDNRRVPATAADNRRVQATLRDDRRPRSTTCGSRRQQAARGGSS